MRVRIIGLVVALFLGTCAWAVPVGAATGFADPAFQGQWQQGEAVAANFWGPLANARDGQQEPYKEASGGTRLVQYFDKGRMELTNGKVTNGLLATELIKGQIQVGDNTFQTSTAPTLSMAGDPNGGPTYAFFSGGGAQILAQTASHVGSTVTISVADNKVTTTPNSLAGAIKMTAYDSVTQHNVAGYFDDYRNRVGLSTIGLAISEPFLADVIVGGVKRSISIQAFERRVLTYTPTNPAAFQVEMGNIGQHYSQWRYGAAASVAAPVAAPSPAASPAAVAPATFGGQTWTDPAGRVSIRIPAQWQNDPSVKTQPDDILGLRAPSLPAVLSVSASPIGSLSLSDNIQNAVAAAQKILPGAQSSPRSLTIGGEPAMFVTYAGIGSGSITIHVGAYAVVFHRGQKYEFFALGSGDASNIGTAIGDVLGGVTFLT